MKKYTIIFVIFAFSCSPKESIFEDNSWTYDLSYWDEESGIIKIKPEVLIKNDSVWSFSEMKKETIRYPLLTSDSTLFLKRTFSYKNNWEDENYSHDTTTVDTLSYKLVNIWNNPVLQLTDRNQNIWFLYPEIITNRIRQDASYFPITEFKISSIQIGDTIESSKITNIKSDDSYDKHGILTAKYINDENLELELINKNIVFSITKNRIDEDEIASIIKVINSKTGIQPDTVKAKPPFYDEGYIWESSELTIQLTKQEMSKYYMDRAEEENQQSYMKTLYLRKALEAIHEDNYFSLEYNNTLLQQILKHFYTSKEVSAIIE
ncbi:hypothetical protein [Peijinzhouia sedimentorum]